MTIYRDEQDLFQGKPVADFNLETGIVDPIDTIYRLRVEYDDEVSILDLLARFANDDRASKVTSLIIGMWGYDESSQAVVELLVSLREKLPNLTALFLGDIDSDENEISWIQQSDISPLLNAYPNLEYLQVRGNDGLSFGNLKHDRLKTFIVESGGLSIARVREVCNSQLPQLEHLELWLGDENYGGDSTVEDLAPILAGNLFPKLNYLGLRDCAYADNLATAVATAPILQKIKVLDLSLGNMGDIGAEALLASSDLKRLEKLDLHHHYISDEVMEKLEQLSIEVDISEEQEADEYDGEEYRYIAVSE